MYALLAGGEKKRALVLERGEKKTVRSPCRRGIIESYPLKFRKLEIPKVCPPLKSN
jgi:hypothetical protein